VIGTLNPDDPNLPAYTEYINHSRPLPEYKDDAPKEINDMLKEEPKPGWVHWFFSFVHNAGLSQEKKEQIIMNVPKGTKLYKNKIQGLRGRATGLIFSNFTRDKNVINKEQLLKLLNNPKSPLKFEFFSAGVDKLIHKKAPIHLHSSSRESQNAVNASSYAKKYITTETYRFPLRRPILYRG
jgi:hypothetical protein